MRRSRWISIAAIIVGLGLVAFPSAAQERDVDGTRMQARHVEVGSVHSDSLSPPQDQADWRMVKFEEGRLLHITLRVESDGRTAEVTLTGATGDELARETAGQEAATIEEELGAGIYYVAVESSEALEYELTIE